MNVSGTQSPKAGNYANECFLFYKSDTLELLEEEEVTFITVSRLKFQTCLQTQQQAVFCLSISQKMQSLEAKAGSHLYYTVPHVLLHISSTIYTVAMFQSFEAAKVELNLVCFNPNIRRIFI